MQRNPKSPEARSKAHEKSCIYKFRFECSADANTALNRRGHHKNAMTAYKCATCFGDHIGTSVGKLRRKRAKKLR